MKKEQLEKLMEEAQEGLLDIKNILQMLEIFLEQNEDEEEVRRSVRLVRKMIDGAPEQALQACRVFVETVPDKYRET